MVADVDGHLLENPQHGAFTDGTVFTLEGVVLRQILDRRLKQRELVGDEGVAVDEVVPVPEVPVGGRSIREVKQGFEVVCLRVIDVRQLIDAFFGLG